MNFSEHDTKIERLRPGGGGGGTSFVYSHRLDWLLGIIGDEAKRETGVHDPPFQLYATAHDEDR